jgi:hypothetical protein
MKSFPSNLDVWIWFVLFLSCCGFVFASGVQEKSGKTVSRAELHQEIASLRNEVAELRKEIKAICEMLSKSFPRPEPKKVWKQVRPSMQIEGMIDDGFELVPEGCDEL